ncbi:hypothetical protein V1498_09885 [Peribacillus sp. SCS-26]|uniref:hypothetical protein n=1 Tax=Paraperibacillus marinus TaxID=3115295 RepID=UPI0039064C1A
MESTNCKLQQKINDLLNRSHEIKKELDETPHQDKSKFRALLSSLLKVHNDLDKMKN